MVAIVTENQKNELIGQEYAPYSYFNPISDDYNNWYITVEEIEQCVNPSFLWVKDLALIGKSNFISTDLYTVNFDESNQILTLNRFDGLVKTFEYNSLPNKQDFDNLKNYIFANYSNYTSVYFQRKDNIIYIINGEQSTTLVVAMMPAEGKQLFDIVGYHCIILMNS